MNWPFLLQFALRKKALNRNLFVDYASKHKLVTSTMNHTYVLATSSSVMYYILQVCLCCSREKFV